jgi:hypothetical protein
MITETKTRKPREIDRVMDRDNERDERPDSTFYENSLFRLPPGLAEAYPDYKFSWVRYAFRDSGEDRENYDMAVNVKGYDPVPESMCPTLAGRKVASPFERDESRGENLIKRGGQVLMMCRKSDFEKRKKSYSEQTARVGAMSTLCAQHNLKTLVDERTWHRG